MAGNVYGEPLVFARRVVRATILFLGLIDIEPPDNYA